MWFLPLFGNQSPLHEDLLEAAHRFIEQERPEHYGVAVVLAQTACEVFTEQVRTLLIQKRQLDEIGEWIAKRTRRADLTQEAIQSLYVALTKDHVTQAPFWKEFGEHVKRRNDVVHKGLRVSKTDAEASCRIVRTVIAHLERVAKQVADKGAP